MTFNVKYEFNNKRSHSKSNKMKQMYIFTVRQLIFSTELPLIFPLPANYHVTC